MGRGHGTGYWIRCARPAWRPWPSTFPATVMTTALSVTSTATRRGCAWHSTVLAARWCWSATPTEEPSSPRQATIPQEFDHLVYLAAFALEAGGSRAAMDSAHQISHEGRPDLSSGIVVTPDDSVLLDPLVPAQCLYNHCDERTVAWALDRLGPQPLVTLQQEPAAIAWRSRPSTYAVCNDDMAVHPDLQRIMAQRCGSVVEWPTDHSPFLCRPDLVTGLLLEIGWFLKRIPDRYP